MKKYLGEPGSLKVTSADGECPKILILLNLQFSSKVLKFGILALPVSITCSSSLPIFKIKMLEFLFKKF